MVQTYERQLREIDREIETLKAARVRLLEPALEAAIEQTHPTSAVAAAEAASQRLLGELDDHAGTGLLEASAMADYVGKHRNWPAENARKSMLIRVQHAGEVLYPAFRIGADTRTVYPWIPQVIELLSELQYDGRSLAVWAAAPSPRFDGDIPALHTGDPAFLRKAAGDLAELFVPPGLKLLEAELR